MITTLVFASMIAAAAAPDAAAPQRPRPRLVAARAPSPPHVDGRLDDDVWRLASPSETFVQHFPDEGAPPSERTVVRVLYDDRNLYVGVDCHQTRSPIVRRLVRRDSTLPSDAVWIDVDSRRDGVSAFHLYANAAGAIADGLHFNDTDFTGDWDGIWEAKVAATDQGYSVEFRIPLTTLRFTALPVQEWGFQVRRAIDARQEEDDWAFYPRSAGNYVPLFGRIENLNGLPPPRALELRPFALGRITHRAPGADGTLARGTALEASGGVDAKIHVTNELSLDLTVNPDFGQVEADTVILNLSTFEQFFPEKRPFFLEGIDTFAGLRPLLYTRRIGRPPPQPILGADRALVGSPTPAPIFGAAKIVGTIGGRTTVGLVSALTGPVDVELEDAGGAHASANLDPWALYHALRLKRFVAENTEVGVLATAANRFEASTSPASTCVLTGAAPAADGRCTNDAYVVSTDGRWRSPTGAYTAAWQAIGETLRNGPDRQDSDGISVRPGAVAGGASLYVAKEGGDNWLWNLTQNLSGRQLDFNDLGYLERKNDYLGHATLIFRTLTPWRRTLDTVTALHFIERRTLEGLPLTRQLSLFSGCTLQSFWQVGLEVSVRGAVYDDREVGDGAALERAANAGARLDVVSDPRRRVTSALGVSYDRRRANGGYHLEAQGQLTFRALPQLELDVLPTLVADDGAPRYVATDATTGAYSFGVQHALSVGTTVRTSYAFTPELTLQGYAQLFVARVTYGPSFTVAHASGTRARISLTDLGRASAVSSSADSEQATFNVNLVLRWEYRLGSTLFLVYTRAQNPLLVPGPQGAALDLRPIIHGAAAVDAIMLKLAYWWG